MNEKSITQKQLFFMIFQSQVGIGLLSLPYSVHEHVQSDGWISVFLAGVSIQLLIFMYWILLWGFKGRNIYEITVIVFGKYVGKFINFLYSFFFLVLMTLLVLLLANLLKKWILEHTPFFIIILLLISTGIYIGKNNLRVLARFYTLATGFVLISIALPWFGFTTNLQFEYLFPIGQSGFKNMIIGSHDAIVAMFGFELILFIMPFVEGSYKQTLKSISFANIIVTLFYVYFTVTCYLIFSPEEIIIVPEPVLYLLKAVNFQWVERLDLIFLSIWIIPMSTSYVIYLYISSAGAANIFHKGQRKYPVWYLTLIVFLIGLLPISEFEIDQIGKYVSLSSYAFIAFIPLLTLLTSVVRKKFNNRSLSS